MAVAGVDRWFGMGEPPMDSLGTCWGVVMAWCAVEVLAVSAGFLLLMGALVVYTAIAQRRSSDRCVAAYLPGKDQCRLWSSACRGTSRR